MYRIRAKSQARRALEARQELEFRRKWGAFDAAGAARAPEARAVFISYRRQLSEELAWSIRKDLTEHRFDVFVDLENLDSGEFAPTILNQIKAREHFIVLLQPGSLDRINEDGDWLRLEIACALALRRNVVPVTAKGFEFRHDIVLPSNVAKLPSLNAVTIPPGYFEEAMEKLRTRFLKTRFPNT
jgi:TIR domain